MDISSRKFRIATKGGAIYAILIGTVTFRFTGPSVECNWATVPNVLFMKEFPLKIFSGDLFYRSRGRLNGLTLHNPDGSKLTTIDPSRRGFYLWVWGKPEPRIWD